MKTALTELEVILNGPAVEGRISVDYLATLARELQATMRRLAKNRPSGTGRFGKEIEDACSLDLVDFQPGSVHLRFAPPPPAADSNTLWGEIGADSLDRMVALLAAGEAGDSAWSRDVPPLVLYGLDEITRPLDNGVTSLKFRLSGAKIVGPR